MNKEKYEFNMKEFFNIEILPQIKKILNSKETESYKMYLLVELGTECKSFRQFWFHKSKFNEYT